MKNLPFGYLRYSKLTDTDKLNAINSFLSQCLIYKDKETILRCYKEAKKLNLDSCEDIVFEEYDRLVDRCNNILTQKINK